MQVTDRGCQEEAPTTDERKPQSPLHSTYTYFYFLFLQAAPESPKITIRRARRGADRKVQFVRVLVSREALLPPPPTHKVNNSLADGETGRSCRGCGWSRPEQKALGFADQRTSRRGTPGQVSGGAPSFTRTRQTTMWNVALLRVVLIFHNMAFRIKIPHEIFPVSRAPSSIRPRSETLSGACSHVNVNFLKNCSGVFPMSWR